MELHILQLRPAANALFLELFHSLRNHLTSMVANATKLPSSKPELTAGPQHENARGPPVVHLPLNLATESLRKKTNKHMTISLRSFSIMVGYKRIRILTHLLCEAVLQDA